MENNLKTSEPDFSSKAYDIFHDDATKSKINRHLVDINDVITEDDIRNIKVSIPGAENISIKNYRNKVN